MYVTNSRKTLFRYRSLLVLLSSISLVPHRPLKKNTHSDTHRGLRPDTQLVEWL